MDRQAVLHTLGLRDDSSLIEAEQAYADRSSELKQQLDANGIDVAQRLEIDGQLAQLDAAIAQLRRPCTSVERVAAAILANYAPPGEIDEPHDTISESPAATNETVDEIGESPGWIDEPLGEVGGPAEEICESLLDETTGSMPGSAVPPAVGGSVSPRYWATGAAALAALIGAGAYLLQPGESPPGNSVPVVIETPVPVSQRETEEVPADAGTMPQQQAAGTAITAGRDSVREDPAPEDPAAEDSPPGQLEVAAGDQREVEEQVEDVPIIPEPELADRQREIDAAVAEFYLLGLRAIAEYELSSPYQGSALFYAQQIEGQQPGRAEAAELLAEIRRGYAALILAELRRGNDQKARLYAQRAVAVGADQAAMENLLASSR